MKAARELGLWAVLWLTVGGLLTGVGGATPRTYENSTGDGGNPRGKVCRLKVLADHTFYQIFAGRNQTVVDEEIAYHIGKMDAAFRATDFDQDGRPDNIGFRVVKQQTVRSENETGYLLASNYSKADDYLAQVANYHDVRDYCLTLVFGYRRFQGKVPENSIFGAAYLAEPTPGNQEGICGDGFNVGFVTLCDKEGVRVEPRESIAYCMTHEMGHAFGARHDEEERDQYPECAPQRDQDKFLMADDFVVGDDLYAHNWLFSECSKRRISTILQMRSNCLVNDTN